MINNGFSSIELWLVIGIIALTVEFFAAPNLGFLFFGLGALSNAIFIYNHYIFPTNQITIFGLFSLIWFLILWWPLKSYIYNKKTNTESTYSDMINQEVEVYSPIISSTKIGQVKWSGVIMNAILVENEKELIKSGERILVAQVKGNILICIKKQS